MTIRIAPKFKWSIIITFLPVKLQIKTLYSLSFYFFNSSNFQPLILLSIFLILIWRIRIRYNLTAEMCALLLLKFMKKQLMLVLLGIIQQTSRFNFYPSPHLSLAFYLLGQLQCSCRGHLMLLFDRLFLGRTHYRLKPLMINILLSQSTFPILRLKLSAPIVESQLVFANISPTSYMANYGLYLIILKTILAESGSCQFLFLSIASLLLLIFFRMNIALTIKFIIHCLQSIIYKQLIEIPFHPHYKTSFFINKTIILSPKFSLSCIKLIICAILQYNKNKMEDYPHTIIEILPNRNLYKKGSFYDSFYQLISGTLLVTIHHTSIEITSPIVIGDYQILQNIDYRIANIKTISKCALKVYPLKYYSKFNVLYKQISSAFMKFTFKNRYLQYWIKKLFFTSYTKRNDTIGQQNSIGIILEGSFNIDRNIPIVRMKKKNLQLLRKFQISQLGPGQIFQGAVVCQTINGIVAMCQQKYINQLSQYFQQFNKVIQVANLKGMVHGSLQKGIELSCRKKSKLFQNMVPFTLKNQIKVQQSERQSALVTQKVTKQQISQNVFRLTNNISQFLHQQWKKGLILKTKNRQKVLGHSISIGYNREKNKNLKKHTLDIYNPFFVQLNPPKKREGQSLRFKLLQKSRKPLPLIRSFRMKSEGDEPATYKKHSYKKQFY